MKGTSDKTEVGFFCTLLLETVFLSWNICENSFQFFWSIFKKKTLYPYSVFVYIFGKAIKSNGGFIIISCDDESK